MTEMASKAECKPDYGFEAMSISPSRLKYFNTSYKKVQSKLSDWRCDVQFRVGLANFRAHRDILSDASEYFFAMFGHDMLEKKQSSINIHEIGPKGFQCLLEYVYHGHLTIDENIIEDILETARYFHVDWMVTVACDFLLYFLNTDNFISIVQLADIYYLDAIYPGLFKFLALNFETLTRQAEFYECITFKFLRDFLDDDVFMDASEGFLLKVVFDWLDESEAERVEYAPLLLGKIRYGLLRTEELENIPSYALTCAGVAGKVAEGKAYARCVNTQCLRDDVMFRERGARSTVVVMSAWKASNGTKILYKDPRSCDSCYEEINTLGLPIELEYTAQATLGNFLFVAGGYEADYVSSDRLVRYDPRYREWLELVPMTNGRVSFAMCSSACSLYVVGGVSHSVQHDREIDVILARCETYDPRHNEWSQLPDLPRGCYGLAAAFGDHETVYVSGGITSDPADSVPTNYMYAYAVGSSHWTPLPSMCHCRCSHAMAAVADKIYAVGGKTSVVIGELADCHTIEMFDTTTLQWSQVTATPPGQGPVCLDIGVFGNLVAYLAGPVHARSLYLYDTATRTTTTELNCGEGYSKVSVLPVAFPRH